jgi:hypothetical protein
MNERKPGREKLIGKITVHVTGKRDNADDHRPPDEPENGHNGSFFSTI